MLAHSQHLSISAPAKDASEYLQSNNIKAKGDSLLASSLMSQKSQDDSLYKPTFNLSANEKQKSVRHSVHEDLTSGSSKQSIINIISCIHSDGICKKSNEGI